MFTIELQTEQASVAQTKHQRLAPIKFLSTMFNAPSQTVTQTMATLHERTTIWMQFVGSLAVTVE